MCDCGGTKAMLACNFKRAKHCGCDYRNPNKTHGMTESREYRSWHNAKVRCHWRKSNSFKNYGGRGIKMCREWRNSFSQFLEDMGPCPDGHSLERIDVNGNYEPSNCKWIPASEQIHNRRMTLKASNGETVKKVADRRGLCYYTLRAAMQRGEDPLTFVPRGH